MEIKTKKQRAIKIICITLAVLMLVSILPAFVLCFVTYPCPGDDYFYSLPLQQALQQNGWSALVTAPIQFAAERYMNWQGSFISCMLFNLNPMVFSMVYYRIAMFVMNLLFVFSVYAFGFRLLSGQFKLKKYLTFLISTALIFAFYHCVPFFNLFEIVYWYTGAIFYFIPLSCLLLFMALLLRLKDRQQEIQGLGWTMAWLIIIGISLASSNLTTAVSVWSGLVILLFLALIKKHPLKKQLLTIFIIYTAVLLVNALSPGYLVRYHHGIDQNLVTIETTNVFDVLIWSFKLGTQNLRDFAFIAPVIGALGMLFPLIAKQAKKQDGRYINPILLFAATYLVFIAQYAPFLYALGDLQYGRIIAYRFFTAQIFYAVNIVNFAAFLAAKIDITRIIYRIIGVVIILAGAFLVFHSFQVRIVPSSHIRTMIDTYMDGTIPTYISEKNERIRILEDESIKDVVFEPLTERDVCFGFDYTDNNPDSLINRALADYYGKDSVIVKEEIE